ncbi:MAG: hypothetical protein IPP71_04045 [Bacteroidetes bacterium]|nr:hypothetical protein [Bacteroidota bacterium]
MTTKKLLITIVSVCFFICFQAPVKAQQNQMALLEELRTDLQFAFNEESVCYKLYDKVKNIANPETVLLGYIGALHIARSRFIPLFDKRESLHTGEQKLEASIKKDPQNVELIFLRLTIQLNLPSILGYNDNIDSDKIFLINNYKKSTPDLRAKIVKFVKESEDFADAEKAKFVF